MSNGTIATIENKVNNEKAKVKRRYVPKLVVECTLDYKSALELLAGCQTIAAYLERLVREDAAKRCIEVPVRNARGAHQRPAQKPVRKIALKRADFIVEKYAQLNA